MSEVKQPDKKSPAGADEGKRMGWKTPAVVGIGVAAIAAAILFQKCSGREAGPDRPAPTPCVACAPAPVKGDNNCEVDKGEHDPLSPTWDPQSCGHCGDGVRQPFEISSRDTRASQPQPASGPRFVVCDVDYHYCGNGQRDGEAQYAAYAPPAQDGGVWSMAIVSRPAESCRRGADNYCEADCGQTPAPAETGRRTGPRTERPERPERPPVQPGRVAACSDIPTSTFSARARDNLVGNASAVRRAVGLMDSSTPVTVRVSLTIGPDGRPTGVSAVASCPASACPQSGAGVGSMVNLSGLSTTSPGESCSTGFTVVVPPG